MTRAEVLALLANMRAVDNRNFDEATVSVWHKVLVDVAIDDALEAVTRHYRSSSDYVMPIHVMRLAWVVAAERHELEASQRDDDPTPAIDDRPARADDQRPGVLVVNFLLAGLAEARKEAGGRLGMKRGAEVGAALYAEARLRYRDQLRPVPRRGTRCGRASCQCTHDVDPQTGLACEGGWLEVPKPPPGAPVLFGEADAPADDANVGRVRACPACDPIGAQINERAVSRRNAMVTRRLRVGSGRR